jgi:hypothetical protein
MIARISAAALLTLSCGTWAANPIDVDATDLWWNSQESGWGVNIIHQSNVMFLTFFVYGPDGRARWYVGPETRCGGAPRDMEQVCTGPLYETSGPVVSTAFDPGAVQRRLVGDVTFLYRRPYGGTLNYRIDGVGTGRFVRRQTWALADLSGEYHLMRVAGANRRPQTGCAEVPTTFRDLGTVIVEHSGSSVRLATVPGPWPRCEYTGTYSQEGRMGHITGSFTCTANDSSGSSAESGTFTLDEVEVSPRGLMARYAARSNASGCAVFGNVSGVRATVD